MYKNHLYHIKCILDSQYFYRALVRVLWSVFAEISINILTMIITVFFLIFGYCGFDKQLRWRTAFGNQVYLICIPSFYNQVFTYLTPRHLVEPGTVYKVSSKLYFRLITHDLFDKLACIIFDRLAAVSTIKIKQWMLPSGFYVEYSRDHYYR